MLKITVCPTCKSGKIKRVKRHWTGTDNEETYTVPNLEFYECPRCGERAYDREAMRRIESRSPAFRNVPAGRSALTSRKGKNDRRVH